MSLSTITNIVTAGWPVVLSAVGLITWLARLEFKASSNSERISRLEKKDDSIDQLGSKVTSIDAKLTVLLEGYNGK